MFERITKAFTRDAPAEPAPSSQFAQDRMSEWAQSQGLAFAVAGKGQAASVEGEVGGRPWKLQLGPPAREYIQGEEVRARCDLRIDGAVSVLVMNRPLKDALEKNAYQKFTDGLQTSVGGGMSEEVRWLALYDEVGWDALPRAFWSRYSVLTDRRDRAQAWLHALLADRMLAWPHPGPAPEVPFLLMLFNGKCYLRMEHTPQRMETLRHAQELFVAACAAALQAFSPRA